MYAIVTPAGGFQNHLRWLMLLDNKFKFSLPKVDPRLPAHGFEPMAHLDSLESKLEFINTYAYPKCRSWHNWLSIEWNFREHLQPLIFIRHHADRDDFPPGTKCLLGVIDPDLAHKCYCKLNSNLNNTSAELFKHNIRLSNKHITNNIAESDTVLKINLDELYAPTLSQALYAKIINFFDLSDQYQAANSIHQTWYQSHCKAEKDIVKYFNELYKDAQ